MMGDKRIVDIEMEGGEDEVVRQSVMTGALTRGTIEPDSRSKRELAIVSAALVERGEQVRGMVAEERKNEMEGTINVIDPPGMMDVLQTGMKRPIHDVVLLQLPRYLLFRLTAVVVITEVAEEAIEGRRGMTDGIAAIWDARGIAATNLPLMET